MFFNKKLYHQSTYPAIFFMDNVELSYNIIAVGSNDSLAGPEFIRVGYCACGIHSVFRRTDGTNPKVITIRKIITAYASRIASY